MIDLTGFIFGKLTVLKRDLDYVSGRNKQARWMCICECGKTSVVRGDSLRNGKTLSCGCISRKSKKIKNLMGLQFGKLTVKSFSHTESGQAFWLCICECGKEKIVSRNSLICGNTKSCGCLVYNPSKKKSHKKDIKDLSGKTFGFLQVLSFHSLKNNKDGKGSYRAYWNCLCKCGNHIVVQGSRLSFGQESCGCLKESKIATELKIYCAEKYSAFSEYNILINEETNRYLPFDIYIPSGSVPEINGIYIEIQGEQHYIKRGFNREIKDFVNQRKRDLKKRKFAQKHGSYIEIDLRKIKTTEQAIKYVESILNPI